ncbi:flagellar biosynthesis protein FlhB [Bacillaceae bacterium]
MEEKKRLLDLQFFAQEKTEKATPRKRQEARKKGQVAKSLEVPAALLLLSSFLFLYFAGEYVFGRLLALFRHGFSEYLLWELSPHTARLLFTQIVIEAGKILLPFFLIAVTVSAGSLYLQTGFLASGEPLKMKWERINPLQGAKRIFSLRSLVEMLKALCKVALTTSAAVYVLWGEKEELLAISQKTVAQAAGALAFLAVKLGMAIAVLLFVLSIFDYLYQRYEHEKNLRMSKQEVKDEYKKTEGDPLIKGKIKERQRQMAMKRMMQEVPKADVVITNPTHYAVALAYRAEEMNAPTVVAKGKDFLALKIKELATAHGVATMEDRWLARTLYHSVEVGEEIPEELFRAVAEVLAYVYRLQGKV